MAKYKVLRSSYIDDRLVEPGEEIEYAGNPSDNLEPLDDAAKKAKAAYAKEVAKLAAPSAVARPVGEETGVGTLALDPSVVKAFTDALAAQAAAHQQALEAQAAAHAEAQRIQAEVLKGAPGVSPSGGRSSDPMS